MIISKKTNMSLALILIAIAAVLLAGCQNTHNMPAAKSNSEATDDPAIMQEISRLTIATGKKQASPADFSNLEAMLKGNAGAIDELNEIRIMVEDKEFEHAMHGLGFLGAKVQGKEVLCPGHALGHYYVFTKHQHTEIAQHSLEEAKDSLAEWEPKAKEYLEQYPGPKTFEEVNSMIRKYLSQIETGNSRATDEEIMELSTSSVCIEE